MRVGLEHACAQTGHGGRGLRTLPSSIFEDISLIRVAGVWWQHAKTAVHELLAKGTGDTTMSLVRLLGFRTLTCGCVVGRYRELATSREVSYVEEKGGDCEVHVHRRNHTIPERIAPSLATVATLRAS